MDDDLIESGCTLHGLERHIHVHEAGHVVAALDFGVQFETVDLYGDEGGPTFDGGLRHAAAAVNPGVATAQEWVLPNPLGALRFVLAGALAEEAILGHPIDDGFAEDVRVWRRGMDMTDALEIEALNERIGTSFSAVIAETREWASTNSERITRVADHLATVTPPASVPYEGLRVIAG